MVLIPFPALFPVKLPPPAMFSAFSEVYAVRSTASHSTSMLSPLLAETRWCGTPASLQYLSESDVVAH